jgi:hypothetical protein
MTKARAKMIETAKKLKTIWTDAFFEKSMLSNNCQSSVSHKKFSTWVKNYVPICKITSLNQHRLVVYTYLSIILFFSLQGSWDHPQPGYEMQGQITNSSTYVHSLL